MRDTDVGVENENLTAGPRLLGNLTVLMDIGSRMALTLDINLLCGGNCSLEWESLSEWAAARKVSSIG